MTEFEIINRYRRLANRDAVPDLACSSCSHPVTVRMTEDDRPLLKCYTCGVVQTVGLKLLRTMEHAIDLYERERK